MDRESIASFVRRGQQASAWASLSSRGDPGGVRAEKMVATHHITMKC